MEVVTLGLDAGHPYAVVAVDPSHVAIVTPTGGAITRLTVREAADVTVHDLDGTLVLHDGEQLSGIDLTSGKVLWSQHHAGGGEMSLGAGRVAVADGDGTRLLDLATGREIYRRADSTGRAARYYDGVGFVLADSREVWLVGDDGQARWTHSLAPDVAQVWLTADLAVAVRKRGEYVAIDPRSGNEVSRGLCPNGKPAWVTARHRALGVDVSGKIRLCADGPTDGSLIAVDEDRNELYVVGSFFEQNAKLNVVGRDAVGRVRWKARWPDLLRTVDLVDHDDTSLVAILRDTHINDGKLLVYDSQAGRLLFERSLAPDSHYVGFSGDCLLLTTRRSAVCLDKRSGARRWTADTYGRSSGLWSLRSGESLLADGNPLALSKLDAAGKRVWQVALPGDQMLVGSAWPILRSEDSHDAEGWLEFGTSWHMSPSMGVQVAGRVLRVLDIQEGTIREIRL